MDTSLYLPPGSCLLSAVSYLSPCLSISFCRFLFVLSSFLPCVHVLFTILLNCSFQGLRLLMFRIPISPVFLFSYLYLCAAWYRGQSKRVSILFRHGAEDYPRRGSLLKVVTPVYQARVWTSFLPVRILSPFSTLLFAWSDILSFLLGLPYALHCFVISYSLSATVLRSLSSIGAVLYGFFSDISPAYICIYFIFDIAPHRVSFFNIFIHCLLVHLYPTF